MLEAIVAGLVSGAGYAIIGVCLVVLYRLVGVLNFSQAAIGAFAAYITYMLSDAGWGLLPAVLVGLSASAVIGTVVGTVMSAWFGEANVSVRSAVTIVVLILLLALGFRVFGDDPRVIEDIVPPVGFEVAGVVISLGAVVSVIGALLLALGVSAGLERTRTGLVLRGIAERPITAELLGVNARRLSIAVWAVMGVVSGLACLLVAPSQNPTYLSLSMLVVPAMAAGLIGAFRSVWSTIVAGLFIGALEGLGARIDAIASYRGALPFIVIVIALLWTRRGEVWDAAR